MQSAALQSSCGLGQAAGVGRRASPVTSAPAVCVHRAMSSCTRQRMQQHHRMIAHGLPVTGPAGSYSEEPASVDAETARISAQTMEGMKGKIMEALETDQVSISDTYGDGRHVSIDVVSPLFEGQSSVKRQRMVYKAIWVELQDTVHAVDAMTTKTPEEAAG